MKKIDHKNAGVQNKHSSDSCEKISFQRRYQIYVMSHLAGGQRDHRSVRQS